MRPVAEKRFDTMGTTAHIVVVGPDAPKLLANAAARIEQIERRWSRFLPSSEVSLMNSARGAGVVVSSDTLNLVEHSVAAWRLTDGRFDPTMALQMAVHGYDRTFVEIGDDNPPIESSASITLASSAQSSSIGCLGITIDRHASEVTLPLDVGFDPGGLGKGLAADIITRELIDADAWGVMVNLGGDLAVKGLPPDGVAWVVTILEPTVRGDAIATVRLRDAGLATSTTAKRRWTTKSQERHHILDPATGAPAQAGAVLATVIAGEAWWAEAAATSTLVNDLVEVHDESSLLVMADGSIERRGDFERFEL